MIGQTALERFGHAELNIFHGEIIPAHHQIASMYLEMALSEIPIGAVIGIALAVARGLNENDDYIEDNNVLVWDGIWYSEMSNKLHKKRKRNGNGNK